MKNLNLKRPLLFLKVQTTGLNPKKDRIIQACFSKIMLDGSEKEGTKLINPGFELTSEITEINGITNEMLKDKPTFEQIAENLNKFVEDCDFVGFNIREFDLQFLIEEFNRSGIAFSIVNKNVVDLMTFYRKLHPRNFKEAIALYLNQEVIEGIIPSSHSVKYSKELIEAMVIKHSGEEIDGKVITNDIEVLSEIFNNHKGQKALDNAGHIVLNADRRPIFTIGKYNNKIVSESLMNDRDYYHWLVDKSEFPADTKLIIKKIVQKAKEAKEAVDSETTKS